jgi:hypothetical protein
MESLAAPSFDEQVQDRVNDIRASAADGCSLGEAHALLSAATLAEVLASVSRPTLRDPNTGKRTLVYQRVDRIQALRAAVLDALVAGELVAFGWDDRQPLDAPPITLPGSRWRSLTPDWDANVARASTAVVSDIRVYRKDEGIPAKPARLPAVPEGLLLTFLKAEARKVRNDTDESIPERDLKALAIAQFPGYRIPDRRWRECFKSLPSDLKLGRGDHPNTLRRKRRDNPL